MGKFVLHALLINYLEMVHVRCVESVALLLDVVK